MIIKEIVVVEKDLYINFVGKDIQESKSIYVSLTANDNTVPGVSIDISKRDGTYNYTASIKGICERYYVCGRKNIKATVDGLNVVDEQSEMNNTKSVALVFPTGIVTPLPTSTLSPTPTASICAITDFEIVTLQQNQVVLKLDAIDKIQVRFKPTSGCVSKKFSLYGQIGTYGNVYLNKFRVENVFSNQVSSLQQGFEVNTDSFFNGLPYGTYGIHIALYNDSDDGILAEKNLLIYHGSASTITVTPVPPTSTPVPERTSATSTSTGNANSGTNLNIFQRIIKLFSF